MRRTRFLGLGVLTLFLLTACNLPPITIDLTGYLPTSLTSGSLDLSTAVQSAIGTNAVPVFTDNNGDGIPDPGDTFYPTSINATFPSQFANGFDPKLDLSSGVKLPDAQGAKLTPPSTPILATPKKLELSYAATFVYNPGTCLQSLGGTFTLEVHMSTDPSTLWSSTPVDSQTLDLTNLTSGLNINGTVPLDVQTIANALQNGSPLYFGLMVKTAQGQPFTAHFDTQQACQTTVTDPITNSGQTLWAVKVDGQLTYQLTSLKLLISFF